MQDLDGPEFFRYEVADLEIAIYNEAQGWKLA